jgi:crossover junction endodeoxyribonuclease RuvC
MKIIGIDPGYDRIGIALIDGERGKEILIHSECFKTSAKNVFSERLFSIISHVEKVIEKYEPKLFGIENLFLEKNQKTAMRVAEVRGALIYLATKHKIEIAEYTPLQVKSAVVGFGRGDKKQVQMMVRQLLKIPSSKKALDDEFDAIAIALTASAHNRNTIY